MPIKVYGIPNCGTCKKAIKWLQEKSVDHEFINTKEQSPSTDEIAAWVHKLGNKPMRNTSGKSYRALPVDKKTWTDEQWIKAFAKDAMLLKRPLFTVNDQAVLTGFRADEAEIKAKLGI